MPILPHKHELQTNKLKTNAARNRNQIAVNSVECSRVKATDAMPAQQLPYKGTLCIPIPAKTSSWLRKPLALRVASMYTRADAAEVREGGNVLRQHPQCARLVASL